MKINCITDTITNRSNEIFVIKTEITEHKLRKILLEITKDCIGCSGEPSFSLSTIHSPIESVLISLSKAVKFSYITTTAFLYSAHYLLALVNWKRSIICRV